MNRFTATITAMAAAIAIATSSVSLAQSGGIPVNYPDATVVVPDWIAGATRAPQWGGAVGGDLSVAGQGERAVEISGGLLRQAEESNVTQLQILAQASAPRCATYSCMTPCCQARRYAVCVQPSPPSGFVYRPQVVLPNPPPAVVAYPPQPQIVMCGGNGQRQRQQQDVVVVMPQPPKPPKAAQPQRQRQEQQIIVVVPEGYQTKPQPQAKPQRQSQGQRVFIVPPGTDPDEVLRPKPKKKPLPAWAEEAEPNRNRST